MNTKSHHLLYMLSKDPDKRNPRGKHHPLSAILGLSVVAMLCGYRSYSAIAEWGRTYGPELAVTLGFTHPQTPCASTLHYCFKDLDIEALEKRLGEWATSVLENMPDTLEKSGVSIDGKTLRGSRTQGAEITHLLTERTHTRTGKQTQMTQYGITSLPPEQASAERLMTRRRGHWTIENLSHRTRDVVLHEDASQVRCGNIPQVMAAGRNATLTLLRTTGNTEIAYALRYFAANPEEALALIGARIDN